MPIRRKLSVEMKHD